MIRSFLALPLPDAVRSALTVQQHLAALPGPLPPEGFHITLVFLGEQPEPLLEDIHERLSELRIAPFPLMLQGLGLFGGAKAHTLWAGVAASAPLVHLQERVTRIARSAGCEIEGRKFKPHVTLARFPRATADERARAGRVAGESVFRSAEWTAEGMVLYRSTLTRHGSRFDPLAEYPFA